MKQYPIRTILTTQISKSPEDKGHLSDTYAQGKIFTQEDVNEALAKMERNLPSGYKIDEGVFSLQIDVRVTDGLEDGQEGAAELKFPIGFIVTEERLDTLISGLTKTLPEGMRIMTRHEAFLAALEEKLGTSEVFAMPRLAEGDVWHDPETADVDIYQSQPWRIDAQQRYDDDNDLY